MGMAWCIIKAIWLLKVFQLIAATSFFTGLSHIFREKDDCCAMLCCCSVVSDLCPMDCSLRGSPVREILQARMLEWVATAFSRGSSQPRDQTQFSCIAGRFFTFSATREDQEYRSVQPISYPGEFPNPGITPGSPALQEDSLQAEQPGKPYALLTDCFPEVPCALLLQVHLPFFCLFSYSTPSFTANKSTSPLGKQSLHLNLLLSPLNVSITCQLSLLTLGLRGTDFLGM